jgi:RNA polymerase sigma-70 factor (ECF subfamily)
VRNPFSSGRGLRSLADEDLMALVAQGRPDAFELLYDRHADIAFSLAYRICGQRAMAEDVLQESMLTVWRRGVRYDAARGSVRTWILATVHNRAIDEIRRRTVRDRGRAGDETLAERLAAQERTDVEVLRRESAGAVRGALHALPAEQRRVIELAYFGGMTHVEISDLLGMPVGTVKSRMRLGLARLRLELGEAFA